MLLITRSDISAQRQVSQSVYDDVINQYIEDAQFLDISELIGSKIYNSIMDGDDHSDLLDGSTYTYKGEDYTHVGLKRVLVYYAYARYVKFGSQTDTPFGFVEKDSEYSTKVSDSNKQATFKLNQQIGYKYWMNVKAFLDRTNYPDWNNDCRAKGGNFRISKIC